MPAMAEPVKIHDTWFEPYISEEELLTRIQAMADTLNRNYEGLNPLFIGVLKGAAFFCTELVKRFNDSCELDFIKVNSYQQMESSGKVQEALGLSTALNARHVILLEDIVDTGVTLSKLLSDLAEQAPASLRIAALTMKPAAVQEPVSVPYLGFEIPNEFVVGFGLDYEQQGRNLNGIYKRKN
jgi:hypoxanthine phosphoribosyltransferase